MGRRVRRCSRVLVFDTADTYGAGERHNALPGFLIARQPGQLKRYWARYGEGEFRILYKPGVEAEKHLEAVCELILGVRDTVLAIDEVWHYCQAQWLPEHLKTLALRGRSPGITMLYTAQRPANVARTLTAVTTCLNVFRVTEDVDLKSLAGRVPAAALAVVRQLPDFHFVSVDLSGNWKVCTSDQAGNIVDSRFNATARAGGARSEVEPVLVRAAQSRA